MTKTRYVPMILAMLFTAFCVSPAEAAEEKVLVIGDSWGAGYADNLQTRFAAHGHGDWLVRNEAIPGTTADLWANAGANYLTLVIATLNFNPNIGYVVVSLGGNDLHGGYPFDQIEADLRTIVGRLSNETYWLQGIILPGYDILEWDQEGGVCEALAKTLFGSALPEVVNPLYLEIGTRQQIVAGEFPKAAYLNLWGTGQGAPGSPNLYAFSPPGYVSDDCIHLLETGYNEFTEELYCQYFAPRFGQTCNTGPVCSVAPGAASAGAGVDGSAVGNGIAFLLLVPAGTAVFWKRRLRHRG